jgi:hypothetical protein
VHATDPCRWYPDSGCLSVGQLHWTWPVGFIASDQQHDAVARRWRQWVTHATIPARALDNAAFPNPLPSVGNQALG